MKYPTNQELRTDLEIMTERIKKSADVAWAAAERAVTAKALKTGARKDLLRAVGMWGDRNDLPMDEAVIRMCLHAAEARGWVQRIKAEDKHGN